MIATGSSPLWSSSEATAVELARAADEHLWQILDHERRARGLAWRLESADEAAPLVGLVGVDEVRAAHPAWQRFEVDALRADHRDHALALLAGVAPFLAHDRRGERRRGHDQDQEFDVVDRLGDLLPPVLAALQVGEVLPERKVVLVLKPTSKLGSECLTVAPGVGDENALHGRYCAMANYLNLSSHHFCHSRCSTRAAKGRVWMGDGWSSGMQRRSGVRLRVSPSLCAARC